MPSTLSISDLDVSFGARTLVRALDLSVSDGDVTALVGPNGSGKSTLLRTVLGDLTPEHGSIRLSPADASIGWLPQVLPDPTSSLRAFARRMTGVAAADAELETCSAALSAGQDSGDEYARALERWLAIGAADFDDRLPAISARVGLDVDPTFPSACCPVGRQPVRASSQSCSAAMTCCCSMNRRTISMPPADN